MMKLKVQHVMDSMLVVTNIINRQCAMPQRGKYLLARLHTKLSPEFKLIDARRDEMIKAYNNPQFRETSDEERAGGAPALVEVPGEWQVPADKMPEFLAAWKLVGDEEIEVDIQPMPLAALSMPDGSDGMIEASELITLGELVYDNLN